MNATENVQAIDVHAHYGQYYRGVNQLMDTMMTGSADTVVRRAVAARTELTIVSPLTAIMPRFKGKPVAGNEEAMQTVAETPGLLYWVVIHPQVARTFDQAAEMLKTPKCMGIKIHPEEHGYPIKEHGRAIFQFAAKHQTTIMTHSGEANSMPEDYVPLADEFPQVNLILAHLGCTCDGDPSHQVRAIQAGRQNNIYVDTSSASSMFSGLIEWAVGEVGPQRLLFGTDSPLYSAATQRARIDHAEIDDQAKRLILRDNAVRLLNLNRRQV